MKIYISGPIQYDKHHREKFASAEARLLELGHEPVNPLKVAVIHKSQGKNDACRAYPHAYYGEDNHAVSCYLRGDIAAMAECDAIYLLNGWESSSGAKIELQVALAMHMDIYFDNLVKHSLRVTSFLLEGESPKGGVLPPADQDQQG